MVRHDKRKESYKPCYRVSMLEREWQDMQSLTSIEVPYEGDVYCLQTVDGSFIVRENDVVSITGNCGHADFGVKVYKKLIELGYPPLTNEEVIEIISGCVDAEISFCKDSLPVSLLGMNSDLMIQYVKNVADGYLNILIGESYYNLPNPFIFMEKLNLDLKTDFFSGKVTNYQQAGIAGGQDELQFGF
jgi:hypothetical protein